MEKKTFQLRVRRGGDNGFVNYRCEPLLRSINSFAEYNEETITFLKGDTEGARMFFQKKNKVRQDLRELHGFKNFYQRID